MEPYNYVTGPQEAGLSGVAAGGGSGPSGVAGVPSRVGAVVIGGDPRGGPTGYVAGGSSAPATGVPSGVAGDGDHPSSESARGRRNYHRHNQHQIRVMEDYFKDDPHPNYRRRNEIAMSIGLEPARVKFWFQNKRNQMKKQSEIQESEALRTENDAVQVRRQQLLEALRGDTCLQCSVSNSQRDNLRFENNRLRNEVELLKLPAQNLQSLVVTSQDRLSVTSQNQANLPITPNHPETLSNISPNPQNFPIAPVHERWIHPIQPQSSENLPIISEEGTSNCYPSDIIQGSASCGTTNSEEGIHSISIPTSQEFRQSLDNLVVLAAEELKVMSMYAEPLWISSSADGATSTLNEEEYRSMFPQNFGSPNLGYTCEASRHIGRVLLSPAQLLDILMNTNEWAFTCSDIVAKALTLDVASEGVNYNAALQVMAAEYHLPSPLVPHRRTYFARYCTQHCEGVWAVVDVSIDKILPAPQNMTCKKMPSGCLIQGMSDGTSKITWIEHVYVNYTGVNTIFKGLLLSGLGFGARRWVSVLERQGQRILSANNDPSTQDFNNLPMICPEGRRGMLMFAERMVNHFIFGITGPRTGTWTEIGYFGDDIRLMSTRAMDEPGVPRGVFLSISTSVQVSLAPNKVFSFFCDYKHREEWDIYAKGNEYEPVCRISYGEETNNCVSIYKVMRRDGDLLELQESWSDPVASHVVFAFTETRTIDAILCGGDPNSPPLLPFGFTILPDAPSSRRDGSIGTLLTISFQILTKQPPIRDIEFADIAKAIRFFRSHCDKIKLALCAVDPNN